MSSDQTTCYDMFSSITKWEQPVKRLALSFASIGAIALLFGVGMAASPATPVPKSISDVEKAFVARMDLIERDYAERTSAARTDRLKGLKLLLDQSMEKKDLETAVQLRDKIKAGEAELAAAAPVDKKAAASAQAALEKALRGTSWQWGEEVITFQANGTVANPGWTANGLVTSWKAIDRRTVLFFIERGRPQNRYAILMFSPNLDSYSGLGFEGTAFPPYRQKAR
jgi:hypothetical protein